MGRIITYLFLFIVGLFVLIFLLLVSYHHFAFPYLFQGLVSFSFIIAGIYFLFRREIALSIVLFILSVVAFFSSNLLFESKDLGTNFVYNGVAVQNLWQNFLNKNLFIGEVSLKTWTMLVIAMLISNGIVLSRNSSNKTLKLVSVNLISVAFTIVVFLLYG